MVAAHTHHRGRLDVSPTIIVSALVLTVRADHLTSLNPDASSAALTRRPLGAG